MTTTFRKKFRNGVLLGILGIGLIAIVITGFGTGGSGGIGSMSGPQTVTLVTVGGEKLTDADITRRMQSLYRQAVSQNPQLDRATFYRENYDEVVNAIVDRMTLVAFARQIGLVVPQSLVDQAIVSNQGFQDVAGQYDDAKFRQFLQANDLSEKSFREEIEQDILVNMLRTPVGGAPRVPQAVSREYANLLLETRVGQFGGVPTALLARSINPSDQDVADYYQRNQRLFQLPERRVIRYALVGRDQLGDAARASDPEIAAYYQEHQSEYGPTETRSLQIFTSQDEAAARRLAERVRGGTSFVEAAQAEGFAASDVTFPNQRREQAAEQTSPEMAGEIFAAQQGGVVGPTRTPSGYKVVRVDAVARNAGRSLESVRAEIVTAIEQRKLAEAINSRSEEIEDQLADGASLEEVARARGLQVQTTPAVTAEGRAPNFQLPAELAPVATAAFQTEPGDPVIEDVQPNAQFAVVEVQNAVAPAAPPLNEIRDQVRQRLIQQQAIDRGKTIAEGIVNRINGGMASAQAYAEAGMQLPNPEPVTARRFQIARSGQRVPPPFTILFAIPEGRARLLKAPNDAGWIIIHHQRRTAGNSETDPQARDSVAGAEQELSQIASPELQAQLARAVSASVGVERNDEAIAALRERLINGQ